MKNLNEEGIRGHIVPRSPEKTGALIISAGPILVVPINYWRGSGETTGTTSPYRGARRKKNFVVKESPLRVFCVFPLPPERRALSYRGSATGMIFMPHNVELVIARARERERENIYSEMIRAVIRASNGRFDRRLRREREDKFIGGT